MKKLKQLALFLATAMLVTACTGCMSIDMKGDINEAGAGTIEAYFGFSEEALAILENTDTSDLTEIRTYNGTTFRGQSEKAEFGTPEEFNQLINDIQQEDPEPYTFNLAQNKDGTFTLTLDLSNQDTMYYIDGSGESHELINEQFQDESTLVTLDPDAEISSTAQQLLSTGGYMVYTLTFPSDIHQTKGPIQGVTMEGGTLTLNLLEMGQSDTDVYIFTTSDIPFSDVSPNAWYAQPVQAMTKGGLLKGYENNVFKPENNITWAEMSMIISRAMGTPGVETPENGYWAYRAVKNCTEKGVMANPNDPNNTYKASAWNITMTREEAIAAMTHLYKELYPNLLTVKENYDRNKIPDFYDIGLGYRQDILDAYKYGICRGMDSQGTFGPRTILTRAMVCQLFYNIGLTEPKGALY